MVRNALNTNTIQKILEMERICFDKPWISISPDSVCIVEDYGYVVGAVGTKSELHRIAVLPHQRGKGLSHSLMRKFLDKCGDTVFLEVASRNAPAIALYKRFGFCQVAVRKGYYDNDDAIVMRLTKTMLNIN